MRTHEQLIDDFIKSFSLYKKKGFKKELVSRLEKEDDWDIGEFESDLGESNVIPDLFYFDDKLKVIHIIEVEVQNPLSFEKLRKYIRLWFMCDYLYWDIDLMIMDRFGNLNSIALNMLYFQDIKGELEPSKEMI